MNDLVTWIKQKEEQKVKEDAKFNDWMKSSVHEQKEKMDKKRGNLRNLEGVIAEMKKSQEEDSKHEARMEQKLEILSKKIEDIQRKQETIEGRAVHRKLGAIQLRKRGREVEGTHGLISGQMLETSEDEEMEEDL